MQCIEDRKDRKELKREREREGGERGRERGREKGRKGERRRREVQRGRDNEEGEKVMFHHIFLFFSVIFVSLFSQLHL